MDFSARVRSPSNRIATSRRVKSPEGIVKEGRKDGDKRNIDTLRLDRDEVRQNIMNIIMRYDLG